MLKKISPIRWFLLFLILFLNTVYSAPTLPAKKLYLREKIGEDEETSLLIEKRNAFIREMDSLSATIAVLSTGPQTPETENSVQKMVADYTQLQNEVKALNKKLEERRITLYKNRYPTLNQHLDRITQELHDITKEEFQQKKFLLSALPNSVVP